MRTLDPYSPSLPRPVSGILEEHHIAQCFKRFKMTPVALAVMALGMFKLIAKESQHG
jgi:hypothetical protein